MIEHVITKLRLLLEADSSYASVIRKLKSEPTEELWLRALNMHMRMNKVVNVHTAKGAVEVWPICPDTDCTHKNKHMCLEHTCYIWRFTTSGHCYPHRLGTDHNECPGDVLFWPKRTPGEEIEKCLCPHHGYY